MAEEALISVDEAEVVAEERTGLRGKLRLPLMAFAGIMTVASFSLVIMIFLSLQGARTGIEALLPFLQQDTPTLQEPTP